MKRRVFLPAIGAFAALSSLGVVHAATQTVSVLAPTPANPYTASGWVEFERDAGVADIAGDYGAPAGLGVQSLTLDTPFGNDKAQAFTSVIADGVPDPLSAVTTLTYVAFRSQASTAFAFQAPALNVEVDVNGLAVAGGFTTLVYEPVYNDFPSAFPTDAWTPVDALDGGDARWWSTNPVPGGPNRDTFSPWSTFVALNPDAVVLRVGVNQGGGNGGLYGAVDGLTYNATTYDFESFVPTKDDCKNGGWATLFAAGTWKNQGQCVASFARLD